VHTALAPKKSSAHPQYSRLRHCRPTCTRILGTAILLLAFYATSIKTSLKTQPLSADHAANKGAIHHVPPRAARQTGAGTAFYAVRCRLILQQSIWQVAGSGNAASVSSPLNHGL